MNVGKSGHHLFRAPDQIDTAKSTDRTGVDLKEISLRITNLLKNESFNGRHVEVSRNGVAYRQHLNDFIVLLCVESKQKSCFSRKPTFQFYLAIISMDDLQEQLSASAASGRDSDPNRQLPCAKFRINA